jgi:uncharacterized cupredoxin-like copper-binding protein
MTPWIAQRLGFVLIAVGLVGVIGTAWVFAARTGSRSIPAAWTPLGAVRGGPTCDVPALSGQTVDVVLSDMSGMMGGGMMPGGRMMGISATPSVVGPGTVWFRVWNAGMMVHELVVLPLPAGGAGTRRVGADSLVSEEGSLGEASSSCGEGAGDGIARGAASWVSLELAPGQYELICNLPGHYAMGMFTELDVR